MLLKRRGKQKDVYFLYDAKILVLKSVCDGSTEFIEIAIIQVKKTRKEKGL